MQKSKQEKITSLKPLEKMVSEIQVKQIKISSNQDITSKSFRHKPLTTIIRSFLHRHVVNQPDFLKMAKVLAPSTDTLFREIFQMIIKT